MREYESIRVERQRVCVIVVVGSGDLQPVAPMLSVWSGNSIEMRMNDRGMIVIVIGPESVACVNMLEWRKNERPKKCSAALYRDDATHPGLVYTSQRRRLQGGSMIDDA